MSNYRIHMDKYYKILGLERGANEADIKKAYKKKALQHHPDKNNNSQESQDKFKEISEAYEILTNKSQIPTIPQQRRYPFPVHRFHGHPFPVQHPFGANSFHVFFGGPGNNVRENKGATLVEKRVKIEGDIRKEIVIQTQDGMEKIQETQINMKTGERRIRIATNRLST